MSGGKCKHYNSGVIEQQSLSRKQSRWDIVQITHVLHVVFTHNFALVCRTIPFIKINIGVRAILWISDVDITACRLIFVTSRGKISELLSSASKSDVSRNILMDSINNIYLRADAAASSFIIVMKTSKSLTARRICPNAAALQSASSSVFDFKAS